ncbi:MAG: amino acid deaminase, partial [Mesorhizobium sp.]
LVASERWHPADGRMSLPVLTLDEEAFIANRDLFLRYAREQGAMIAPHAKTPMAPDLARSLVEAGAWGTTVADIRQAAVMLRAGLTRQIIANEVGGSGGANRLAALAGAWPSAELFVFADSVAAVNALAGAWRANATLPPLRVLVELGAGRAGART